MEGNETEFLSHILQIKFEEETTKKVLGDNTGKYLHDLKI